MNSKPLSAFANVVGDEDGMNSGKANVEGNDPLNVSKAHSAPVVPGRSGQDLLSAPGLSSLSASAVPGPSASPVPGPSASPVTGPSVSPVPGCMGQDPPSLLCLVSWRLKLMTYSCIE